VAGAGGDGAIDVVDGLVADWDHADMAIVMPLSTTSRSREGNRDVVSYSVLAADVCIYITIDLSVNNGMSNLYGTIKNS